jgi:hypothetical protein
MFYPLMLRRILVSIPQASNQYKFDRQLSHHIQSKQDEG